MFGGTMGLRVVGALWIASICGVASAEGPATVPSRATGTAPLNLAVVDHLLTTTRTVRRRLDLTRPVEPEVIEQAIEVAIQAPSGRNRQGWRFMVVTDPEKKRAIPNVYRRSFEAYGGTRPTREPVTAGERIAASAWHLSEHMHEVPVLVIACIEGRVEDRGPAAQASHYGSMLPSAWSLMLALRARGLGSAWTTLHLVGEKEVAQILWNSWGERR